MARTEEGHADPVSGLRSRAHLLSPRSRLCAQRLDRSVEAVAQGCSTLIRDLHSVPESYARPAHTVEPRTSWLAFLDSL
jgi:hypothetical protein